MPLTSSGFTATRAAQFRTTMIAAFAATGLNYDLSVDQPLGWLLNLTAELLGELSETIRAVYDSRLRSNAQGVQLDDIGALVGVLREAATYSSVTLTLSGVPGTYIPAGSQAQGGGTTNLALWATSDDVTIGAGGTVDVTAVCTVTGPVAAPGGSVTLINTPVTGWSAVVNSDDAALGSDIQSDASYRLAQKAKVTAAGANRSVAGIRAALEAVDGVLAASVAENSTDSISDGIDPRSIRAVLYPSSLTAEQRESAATVLYDRAPLSIGTTGAQSATVTDLVTGVERIVYWDWAATESTDVDVELTTVPGTLLSDVTADVQTAIASLFADYTPGDDVYVSSIIQAVLTVEGVRYVDTVLIDSVAANKNINYDAIATLSTVTVT